MFRDSTACYNNLHVEDTSSLFIGYYYYYFPVQQPLITFWFFVGKRWIDVLSHLNVVIGGKEAKIELASRQTENNNDELTNRVIISFQFSIYSVLK